MSKHAPLAIYLDQFQWIDLARAYYGKQAKPAAKQILPKIIDAVEGGRAIFPLSLFTLVETEKRADEGSRHRLAEFIIKVSKGYTITPYISIKSLEVWLAMLKRWDIPVKEIVVIKKGISNLLGGKPSVEGNISEELKRKLIEEVEKPESILLILKLKEMSDYARKEYYDLGEHVRILERLRIHDSQVKDRTERYYGTMIRFFQLWIDKEMARLTIDLDLPKEAIQYTGRQDVEAFFQSMPSLYCIFNLTFARDLEKSRKIAANDSVDIHALAVAIPYCDVVLTEAFWVKNAKQQRLDKIYGTKILSSFQELDRLLESQIKE